MEQEHKQPVIDKEELTRKYAKIRELADKIVIPPEKKSEEPPVKKACQLPLEPGKRCEACEDS